MSVYSMPHCLAPGNFSFPDIIFICTLLLPLKSSFLSYRCNFFVPSFGDLVFPPPRQPPLLSSVPRLRVPLSPEQRSSAAGRQGGAWRWCRRPGLPRCSDVPAADDAAANFTAGLQGRARAGWLVPAPLPGLSPAPVSADG